MLPPFSLSSLNKRDLFTQKLKSGKLLKNAFPDYTGGNGYGENLSFVRQKIYEITRPDSAPADEDQRAVSFSMDLLLNAVISRGGGTNNERKIVD